MTGATGAALTTKFPGAVAVPSGVVTAMGPVVALGGTVAWMAVSEVTVNAAAAPLKVTIEAPVKPEPVTVTLAPGDPSVGAKPVIVGGPTTMKLVALAAVPSGVTTVIGPLVALDGTIVCTAESETTANSAERPLNLTAVVPVKLAPMIETSEPARPLEGVKRAIVGGRTTVNSFLLVAVPAGVVRLNGPVGASVGTIASIVVAEVTIKLAVTP